MKNGAPEGPTTVRVRYYPKGGGGLRYGLRSIRKGPRGAHSLDAQILLGDGELGGGTETMERNHLHSWTECSQRSRSESSRRRCWRSNLHWNGRASMWSDFAPAPIQFCTWTIIRRMS